MKTEKNTSYNMMMNSQHRMFIPKINENHILFLLNAYFIFVQHEIPIYGHACAIPDH